MVAAMKFIVVVLTLHLLCEDVQADVAASGLNSVRLPDIAFLSVGLYSSRRFGNDRRGMMRAQQSCSAVQYIS